MATRHPNEPADVAPPAEDATRRYVSPLRRAQVDQTRELILAALAAQLPVLGWTEFSIPDAARRAGVSVRTVYNHFPNRQAQLEAVARWLDSRIAGDVDPPKTADELPDLALRLYAAFAQNEPLVRAQASPGLARLVRRTRRAERTKAIDDAVKAAASQPDSDAARWASALITHLIGADAGIPLKDDMGLSIEESGRAVAWAIQALLAALDRSPRNGDSGLTSDCAASP